MEMATSGIASAFLPTDFAAGIFPSRCTPAGVLITLAILVTTLIATLATKKAIFGSSTHKGAAKLRQPPGPRPLPIIGNMHQLAGGNLSLPRRLMELSATYGPVMSLHLGSVPMVVVSSAEAVEQFLKVQDKVWSGRPRSLGFKILSNDFKMAPDTPYWWQVLRKLFHRELLSHSQLEAFRKSRTEEFDRMVRSIYEDSCQFSKEVGGEKHDVKLDSKLTTLSANNITNMMLGKRLFGAKQAGQEVEFQSLVYKYLDITKSLLIGDIVPSLKWLSYVSGSVAAMKKVASDCDKHLQTHLDEKRRAIVSETETKDVVGNSDIKRQQDLVDVLMQQPALDGNGKLDDTSIACLVRNFLMAGTDTTSNAVEWAISELLRNPECMKKNFLVAGTDTTSNVVEWAISELLRNPECMKKLQTELDSVVGTGRVVTEADLPALPYLQAVVKETLRLYPQGAIFIPHVALEDTTVCGYEFRAATWLMVNSLAIHLDERYWPNAQQFDPERFLGQPEKQQDLLDVKGTNLHYMPFGIGRHQCSGMWLGLLTSQIGVARLAQAFEFSLADGEDPRDLDMTEKFCQSMPRMHPLVLKAHPRLAPHLY